MYIGRLFLKSKIKSKSDFKSKSKQVCFLGYAAFVFEEVSQWFRVTAFSKDGLRGLTWVSAAKELRVFFLGSQRGCGNTHLPAQEGGMMSGGGSSLNGILETEKIQREKNVFVNSRHPPAILQRHTRTQRQCQHRCTSTESKNKREQNKKRKPTVRTGRKVGAKEKEGRYGQLNGAYISRSNKQRRI